MALIKWEPFRDIDRFFNDDWFFPPMTRTGWDLAVDVYEDDKNNIVAEMQLPGVDPEKIDINVEDSYLLVSGRREEEKEQKEKNYYSKEIRRGSFERVVRLPSPVQSEKADAEYEDGVLRVTIPKQKEEEEKRVKVKVKKGQEK